MEEFKKQFLELLKNEAKREAEDVIYKLSEINKNNENELKSKIDKILENQEVQDE
jgi:hypothetical protein